MQVLLWSLLRTLSVSDFAFLFLVQLLSMSDEQRAIHIPVMPREVLQWLQLSAGLTVLDGTLGAAGHSSLILKAIGDSGRLVGLDRDPMMLRLASQKLKSANATLIRSSYSDAATVLKEQEIPGVDRVLLDLGLSSDQLADRNRGFGFDAGGPLDMRFHPQEGRSAAEVLQEWSESELERIFLEYGEEPQAARVAAAIGRRRRRGQSISTGEDLVACIAEVCGNPVSEPGRTVTTRVFQALRIAVNEELMHVEKMLTEVLPGIMNPGGIAVVISFHSLEDRLVKNAFKGHHGWQVLTKTPIEAMPAEVRINPRSRPAKLRAAKWLASL